jgi:hypothetical protein
MTDTSPGGRHADDAHSDDAPPTDAVTDDVREDAASAGDRAETNDEAEDTP